MCSAWADTLGRIYLFGSRVNDTKKGGDIDLLFESSIVLDLKRKLELEYRLSSECDTKVDLLVKSPGQEENVIFAIARSGVFVMNRELEILLSNVDACGQRIAKLIYPEAVVDRVARLNMVVGEADFVIGVFREILAFMLHKWYLVDSQLQRDAVGPVNL